MDTNELLMYMKNDVYITLMMGGVMAKDLLPNPTSNPKLFILNLDKSNERGSHWIALLLSNNYISEYFDPLGHKPDIYIKQYFNKHCIPYLVSTQQYQSPVSSSCGKFCLFYCYLRARGKTMQEIVQYFNDNTLYNEVFIDEFYNITSFTL